MNKDKKDETLETRDLPDNGKNTADKTTGIKRSSERLEQVFLNVGTIGSGSFGTILSGHDPDLGREVAIKTLKPQFRKGGNIFNRFMQEARATAQLEHPNIMPVHEIGYAADSGIYFTMKKTGGESLRDLLHKLASGSPEYLEKYNRLKLLEIFTDICHGVAFAHSRGIIHRDLKPANIQIGEFGEVLIMDWGLAKNIDTENRFDRAAVNLNFDESDGMQTIEGSISGTPNYMSPEQASGNISELDEKSDQFSLGIILYEILTLQRPFEMERVSETLEKVRKAEFLPPRKAAPEAKIPKDLEAICLKAMSKNKSDRYPDVERLIQDIRNSIGHLPVTARRMTLPERLIKLMRRHRISSAVILALLIGGLNVGIGIAVSRTLRFRTTFNIAAGMQQKGDDLFRQSAELLQKLESIPDGTPYRAELQAELSDKVRTMSSFYLTAVIGYNMVPVQYRDTPEVRDRFMQTLRRQAEMNTRTGNIHGLRQERKTIALWIELFEKEKHPDNSPRANRLRRLLNEIDHAIATLEENGSKIQE